MNSKLIEVAKTFLNVRESKVNNIGKEIQIMQLSTWLKPAGWPWCAAFTCHVLHLALQDANYHNYIMSRYHGAENPERWRCKDASAFGWIEWAKKLKPKHSEKILFDENSGIAKVGDFVVFDFSHIGIVDIDQFGASAIINTIEGNTQPKTVQRDGANDGVYEMIRNERLVRMFIRL
jgi:hypothetical protein